MCRSRLGATGKTELQAAATGMRRTGPEGHKDSVEWKCRTPGSSDWWHLSDHEEEVADGLSGRLCRLLLTQALAAGVSPEMLPQDDEDLCGAITAAWLQIPSVKGVPALAAVGHGP